MTEITQVDGGKKTKLTKDDVCLGRNIYFNMKEGIFFEYVKFQGKDYLFAMTEKEAKEALKKIKNVLTEAQIKICKKIWSDF
jgi:hypothetical protein